LKDDPLLQIIQQELSKGYKKSKTGGRPGTPAEVVLRMLLLKHMRGWSYEDVTREVRANLVYREFTGIGGGKVPDDKTMGRLAPQLGAEAIQKLHQRTVAIALEKKVVAGRKMRVDTTVVETNIHYPTGSRLLGDGVRVLIRVMKKVAAVVGEMGTKFRDRSRSVKRRVVEIAYASRDKSEKGQQKMKVAYGKLLEATSRVVGQAKKFSAEIAGKVKKGQRVILQKAKRQPDEMIPRVQQLLSVFEPDTELIRKGKASKPTEFGKMVKIQEAENQIVIHCWVEF
jgi:IS5 family transposase